MGILDWLTGRKNINDAVEDARKIEGAVIVDVRSAEEFAEGHIPGALNVNIDHLGDLLLKISGKDVPVYCYCLTGARSGRAANMLRGMGFDKVTNLGGFRNYNGPVEK